MAKRRGSDPSTEVSSAEDPAMNAMQHTRTRGWRRLAALEAVRDRGDRPLALAEADDVGARLDAVAGAIMRSVVEREGPLRTLVRLTMEQPLDEARGGPARAAPLRGLRRIEWIETALVPARSRLGAARYERLASALALCIGYQALLVLRDIRGLEPAAAEAVSRWAAHALLQAVHAEAAAPCDG
ncbi:MAG TPA: hypothetical protein VFL91_31110 [Thermomicrobiales bacterium]|nr:hypothetical protein [Thermomicrobiales bacterium]